jgi:Dolichyl-phosphate-mannose-protein mannosyltransferase
LNRFWRHRSLFVLLGLGLAFRLVLALVVFPGQGLSSDLGFFEGWATTLARVGPGAFYATASQANYPPGYMYVLWLVGAIGSAFGSSSEHVTLLLIKVPAVLADIALAAILYAAARRWFGGRAGLVAAALYLFIPVTWYDSALWGQVDAVGTLVMVAAIVLLVEGWSEPAAALAAFSLLVKPQDAIIFVVLVPVLVRRHLLRRGSGPAQTLGPRLTRLNRRLGGLLTDNGPLRLATSAAAAALAGILPLIPFDIGRYAPASLADVPVIGQVAGLIGLFVSDGGQFSYLTANAFNPWALVGSSSLASIAGSGGTWTADSLLVFGGLQAVTLGALLLGITGLLVAGGLLIRADRLAIILGFTLVAVAFYILPTRVHERYLFPAFGSGVLLAAAAVRWALGYLGLGLLNTVNLHAVLAGGLNVGGGGGGGAGPGGGFGGSGFGGGGAGGGGATSISLPLADLARSEPVIIAVALGQTLIFVSLLIAWAFVVLGPLVGHRLGRTSQAAIGA